MAENRTNKDEQILRLTDGPDFENMTPEEYEQWQKEISDLITEDLIKEIEKKALERLRNPRRGTLRDYIEK